MARHSAHRPEHTVVCDLVMIPQPFNHFLTGDLVFVEPIRLGGTAITHYWNYKDSFDLKLTAGASAGPNRKEHDGGGDQKQYEHDNN